ncbi:hypothetical protein SAMN02800694_0414 [Luteibacter sp. UNCMF331Sha3.1]|uniref:hypothetical protein n=1 Tax=Luteibacter sp. UNCMF331Sha3.1 TaxID=1502760 RepID=UPI0008B57D53|nr:hypothetical protein [Luteibacter sp. UNCMF331Sha3.1]SEM26080.1 hypothetical protein SAMN02800694_0414 [Luteibacter sp. UNCMF331Sha3.1]
MKVRTWALVPLLCLVVSEGVAETRRLDAPPLNPHPTQAIHITVSFVHQEDARRYSINMTANYKNRQSECGYVSQDWSSDPVYLETNFTVPNKSLDPRTAKFDIYWDRYNERTCNWALFKPDVEIRDRYSLNTAVVDWGYDDDLIPGSEFRTTCPFPDELFTPVPCFDRGKRIPDVDFFNRIPANKHIELTIQVSKDSTPPGKVRPDYFSDLPLPVLPTTGPKRLSQHGTE